MRKNNPSYVYIYAYIFIIEKLSYEDFSMKKIFEDFMMKKIFVAEQVRGADPVTIYTALRLEVCISGCGRSPTDRISDYGLQHEYRYIVIGHSWTSCGGQPSNISP